MDTDGLGRRVWAEGACHAFGLIRMFGNDGVCPSLGHLEQTRLRSGSDKKKKKWQHAETKGVEFPSYVRVAKSENNARGLHED